MADRSFTVRWVDRLTDVRREAWDALAGPLATPFLEWDWLWLMEASGSASAEHGWVPHHLTVWSGGELVAAAPMYIKLHSAGEFVFDHAWAEVGERMGVNYYPKLVGMSPFTPMVGYRFLMAPGLDEEGVTAMMVAEIDRACRSLGLSGSSFLFVDQPWVERLSARGYSPWAHQSFIWRNNGYRDFGDYLAGFNANQRRNIRREIQGLERQGVSVDLIPGPDLSPADFERMYAYYLRTNQKFGPWGCRYLTREFFSGLRDCFNHRLLFAAAFDRDRRQPPLGLSLMVTKGPELYGRYWGSATEVEFLHFSACYYRPIEWAIARGIRRFDPGAGGGHKLRRGFEAVANYSLHRFADTRLRGLMERHIESINRLELAQISALNRERPLRQPMS